MRDILAGGLTRSNSRIKATFIRFAFDVVHITLEHPSSYNRQLYK